MIAGLNRECSVRFCTRQIMESVAFLFLKTNFYQSDFSRFLKFSRTDFTIARNCARRFSFSRYSLFSRERRLRIRSRLRYSSRCLARYALHRIAFAEGGSLYELALEDSEEDITIFLPRVLDLPGAMLSTGVESISSVDCGLSEKLEPDDSEDDMTIFLPQLLYLTCLLRPSGAEPAMQ